MGSDVALPFWILQLVIDSTAVWSSSWWRHQMETFPRHWLFVRGIHRSLVNSPHKGQWRGALMFSLIYALNKRLSKQSWGWWFETPTRSLWSHCNACPFFLTVTWINHRGLVTSHCVKELTVKVQFRGLELFKRNGALFQEEFYPPSIFRPSLTSCWYDCERMAPIRT